MKFRKKIREQLRKCLGNFNIKSGKNLQKIYGNSKLISETFESKNFRILRNAFPEKWGAIPPEEIGVLIDSMEPCDSGLER